MGKTEKGRTADVTQQEIEKLKADIEAYKASGIKMGNQITALKKQLSGYKGRCSQLTKDAEKLRALDKEGDELNEKRIAELETKETVIRGLQSQVQELSKKYERLKGEYEKAKNKLEGCLELIGKFAAMPWYKRIFWKG